MHRILLLLTALAATAAAPVPGDTQVAARPARIVSLNLCSDQYLLALADPGQIAALTRYARDPQMSAAAEKARSVPIFRATAEEVLALRPDLVIGVPARRSGIMAVLAPQHYRTVPFKAAENYGQIVAQIRTVAKAVGHVDRGEALIAKMNAELARLPRPHAAGIAAYYQRRGYLTGTGTLVDDLMRRAGLTNLAGKLGKPALSQISIEEMVAAQPDYLLVESSTDRVVDQGTEMLHHPALRGIRRLHLPQAWTVCGGPAYVLAARSLAEQLAMRH
jgi:iron complex transport system substrate-binding protein